MEVNFGIGEFFRLVRVFEAGLDVFFVFAFEGED